MNHLTDVASRWDLIFTISDGLMVLLVIASCLIAKDIARTKTRTRRILQMVGERGK